MRLDRVLVERGLVRSRNQAARLIADARVRVGGVVVTKPAFDVGAETIEVDGERYVSRAAYKLLGALDASGVRVPARVLDAGACTGGFTQVLLERGAEVVYAVDVGHGQLASELRADPRVVVREGLNLRGLARADLDGQGVDLIVGDVSFISLRLLLAPLFSVLSLGGMALLLVKPQFEVGREALGHGGVVTNNALREQAVAEVIADAERLGARLVWQAPSGLPGADGNIEHFVLLEAPQDYEHVTLDD